MLPKFKIKQRGIYTDVTCLSTKQQCLMKTKREIKLLPDAKNNAKKVLKEFSKSDGQCSVNSAKQFLCHVTSLEDLKKQDSTQLV